MRHDEEHDNYLDKRRSRKTFIGYFFKFVYVILIIAIASLIFIYRKSLLQLWVDHPVLILSSILIGATYINVQAYNFLQLLEHTESFNFFEVVRVWSLTSLANYLGPFQPGLLVRFGFFKTYNISVLKTAKTTLRQIQLNILTGMFLASIALIFGFQNSTVRTFGILLFSFLIILPIILRVIRYIFESLIKDERFRHFYSNWAQDLLTIPPFTKFYLFFIQHSIMALLVFIVYNTFTSNFSIFESFLVGILTTLSTLLAIAPNNLGIQEVIFSQISVLKGMETPEAIGIALIFRITQIGGCVLCLALAKVSLKLRRTGTISNE